ncbi:MAG: hypothetical protein IPM24_27485 [Bryobacterales bacterium]|nr:hypothetical protein [Bryobacterales bacterium]
MVTLGLTYVFLSGLCNGLFTAPMKIIPRWKWENIWFVFILTACLAMPSAMVFSAIGSPREIFAQSPGGAVAAAVGFGFAWGFGAILFGLSVHHLGVSVANSLVIGLSSALGSIAPLIVRGQLRLDVRQGVLFLGILTFLAGVWLCGRAGRMRDKDAPRASLAGYLAAVGAGVMSAVFNIGYSLALPIADTGEAMGYSRFDATNCIWLLMLGAGSIPNIGYCGYLMRINRTGRLLAEAPSPMTWGLSIVMGLLWGGSIFLYGAATPRLGDIGPSIGWPLSLAVALLVANLMGVLLKEWRGVDPHAVRLMRQGIATLLVAIVICGASSAL